MHSPQSAVRQFNNPSSHNPAIVQFLNPKINPHPTIKQSPILNPQSSILNAGGTPILPAVGSAAG